MRNVAYRIKLLRKFLIPALNSLLMATHNESNREKLCFNIFHKAKLYKTKACKDNKIMFKIINLF